MGLSDTIVPEETDQFLAHFRHACVTHLMNIRLLATICFFFLCLIHTYHKCRKLLDFFDYIQYSFENWFCLCDRSPLILQGYWTWSDPKSSFAAEEIAPVLQCIFQKSLDTGELPLDWRKANITRGCLRKVLPLIRWIIVLYLWRVLAASFGTCHQQ